MTAILDAILNISNRSMMPEWHQLDSSSTMPKQQESTEKQTLKSSSRSFWFSTGLILDRVIPMLARCRKISQRAVYSLFQVDLYSARH